MPLTFVDWIVIVGYLLINLLIGIYYRRRASGNTGMTRYRSIPQTIRVASSTAGSGVTAQSDTLGYYIDHGQPDGITVPSQPPN